MTLQQDYTLQDGKYRILKVLGQGGFGITYLAIQVRLDRKVAIKEFFMKDFCERNETTSQVTLGTAGSRETVNSCREKFLKEAKHIAKLDHPNIIHIIEDFDENSTSYYVMEYIEGGSLENKLGTTGLSMSDATRYILQVAEALKYIHEQKIAHLDIKPSNIMLNGNDEIVLIDFGVSKQYDFSTGGQTSVSPASCSFGYAPLEQYDPNGVKEFSPKPDIYSLGATYFKLLTGITPLNAFGITKDFLQENLKAKGVPTAVISIICKSMEKLQENRFSDVCSFIEELNSIGLLVEDSSDKKDENIAYKLYEEGTAVMPSQEKWHRICQEPQINTAINTEVSMPVIEMSEQEMEILQSLKKNNQYKEAYYFCLDMVRQGKSVEYSRKECEKLIVSLQKKNKKDNRKLTLIGLVLTILFAIMYFFIGLIQN